MGKISNNEVRYHVEWLKDFKTNNGTIIGRNAQRNGDVWYVVYSYGIHFPMYLCDSSGQWFGNSDKWSRTTTNHQSKACPYNVDITWVSREVLMDMDTYGPREYIDRVMRRQAA